MTGDIMKYTILMLIFCLILPLAAREDSDHYRAIIKPYAEEFSRLMQQNRFEELLDFYDKNITLIRPFSPPIKGRAAMRQEMKMLNDVGYRYHSLSGETIEVWGCDDQIFERATIAFSYSTDDEPTTKSYYGSNLAIWKKQADGSYKLYFSIWNLDFNPWEP